ncbi:MAG: hypothetical protein K6G81_12325 [Lachnospiraceae bacterium]|nr:hypothetical protein [Lachnospiraceae bacterium]
MDIKKQNAIELEEILEKIGHEDAVIQTRNDWVLRVYYSEKTAESVSIEMCLSTDYQGESLFDPLMSIDLTVDDNGAAISASPVYYLSRTPFVDVEIYAEGNPSCYNPKLYEKPGELDSRLAEWLKNIKIQGYLSDGTVSRL